MVNPIQVTRSSMPDFAEYMEEIKDLWECRCLTNMGDKHKKLEAELVQYLQVPNVTLFTNGHLALECAIAALGLTGEVITTPFTFASTTHAIVRNGLVPVFCDIEPDTYNLDVGKLESLITKKTSAIVPVHVYGNACDVEAIEAIAKKNNLKVIYDAAHAFGVTVNGRGIGNYGDASMFSFHATKVFHTIEGGAITYNSNDLKILLNHLKNFGITGPESVEYVGGNAKMNEFQAAMGICNLRHIDQAIEKRKAVVERYRKKLDGVRGIKLISPQKDVKSNYAYFPVLFDGYRLSRDEIYEMLKKEEIISRKYFYPLINSFECYRNRFRCEETAVAKYISDRIMTLPLYEDLAMEDVDRICNFILNKKVWIKTERWGKYEGHHSGRRKRYPVISDNPGRIKATTADL
ncbi:MAG: aminotransferase [Firmicutes bacterium]|nr:aminotransferase [Bacillota bacterium]